MSNTEALRAAAQQALLALEAVDNDEHWKTSFPATVYTAIIKLRAALAQPAASGEPVAWRWPTPKLKGVEWRYTAHKTRPNAQPLYAAPGAPDAQKGMQS